MIISQNMSYFTLLYVSVSQDWELPISRIWLAKIDIDRGLDFAI